MKTIYMLALISAESRILSNLLSYDTVECQRKEIMSRQVHMMRNVEASKYPEQVFVVQLD